MSCAADRTPAGMTIPLHPPTAFNDPSVYFSFWRAFVAGLNPTRRASVGAVARGGGGGGNIPCARLAFT